MSLPLGIVITIAAFVYSIGLDNMMMYVNMHSIAIVVGGTFGIFLFTAPTHVLKNLGREIFGLFKSQNNLSDVKSDLVQLAKNKNVGLKSSEELISYAQDLWSQGVDNELFITLLSQKRKEIEQRSVEVIQSLKNLAKYPPALGMAGTVIGIVSLFKTLGSDKDKLGPALALALTATLFGLVVANVVVMPLADRLQIKHLAHKQYLQNVYQLLLLINQEESTNLIEDEVTLRAA